MNSLQYNNSFYSTPEVKSCGVVANRWVGEGAVGVDVVVAEAVKFLTLLLYLVVIDCVSLGASFNDLSYPGKDFEFALSFLRS
ncbi:hypothetical protein Tco_1383203 [Tanacetum coccineum]